MWSRTSIKMDYKILVQQRIAIQIHRGRWKMRGDKGFYNLTSKISDRLKEN